jgi:hypothetical protein
VQISKHNHEELRLWGGQAQEVQRNFDMEAICAGISARITEAVLRGLRSAKESIDYAPALAHERLELALPLRLVFAGGL